jgi:hypothetical protein
MHKYQGSLTLQEICGPATKFTVNIFIFTLEQS